jgi:hypothetical protein
MSERWFCKIKDKQYGPLSAQQLRAAAKKNLLSPNDAVKKGETGQWVRAGKVRGLFPESPAGVSPSPPVSAQRKKTGPPALVSPAAHRVVRTEHVLFWRPIGTERTFISSRYLALCITTERILLLNLGYSTGWMIAFGLIGYYIGKRIAENKAHLLRDSEPRHMLANAPESESIARSDITGVKLHRSRLTIVTYSRGSRTFTFKNLTSANDADLRAAIEALTNPRSPSGVDKPLAAKPGLSSVAAVVPEALRKERADILARRRGLGTWSIALLVGGVSLVFLDGGIRGMTGPDVPPILTLVGWVAFGVGIALAAKYKGRSAFWGLTILPCCVGAVVVLFLRDLNHERLVEINMSLGA